MSTFTFQKAERRQRKARIAVFGPSGSGKTYTSLAIGSGLGERIALIDTERHSASLYGDRFPFETCNLESHTIDDYCGAIEAAGSAGFDVLIIDSLSHGWHELLDEVEKIAKTKYRGNTWSAWSEGTPKQRQLVNAILNYPGHVLATMRSKTEWTTQKNSKGRDTPVRVGLSPEQGKGIEYEFDMLLEINTDHMGSFIKDRSGQFQDKVLDKPGREVGEQIAKWLGSGAEPAPEPKPQAARNGTDWDNDAVFKNAAWIESGKSTDVLNEFCETWGIDDPTKIIEQIKGAPDRARFVSELKAFAANKTQKGGA